MSHDIGAAGSFQRGHGKVVLTDGARCFPAPGRLVLTGGSHIDASGALLVNQGTGVGIDDAQTHGGVLNGSGCGVVQLEGESHGLTGRHRRRLGQQVADHPWGTHGSGDDLEAGDAL